MPVNTRIQIRRGTANSWITTDPNVVLSAGEIGYETDTGRIKIGDGTTTWNSLSYNAVVPTGFLAGSGLSVSTAADGSTVTYSLSNPTIEVSDITDFIDGVNDRVADLLTAGSNIQLSYTDNNDDSSTLQIAVTGVSLSGHTHSLSEITDVTASATEVNYLDLVTGAGTVDATKAVVVDSSKNITGFNNIGSSGTITASGLNTSGDVTVGGNLVVNGSTTIVNSTEVEIGDNIITVNTSGLPEGGFRVFNGSIYKSLIWNNTNNRWEFSGPEIYTSGLIKANTFESTVAGPTAPIVVASTGLVANLNADLLDGQDGTYYLNYNNFSNTPTIGSGILTLNVSGSGLSGTASFGANDTGNTTFTVTSNATPANTANTVVSRDSSGNFTATNITASGFIGNGSSLTNLNASNLSTGTVASGLLPNVTVGSTSTGPTGSFVSSVTTDAKGRVTSVNTTTHTLATTSVQGIASFDSGDFSVAAGVVSVKASGISNNQLVNDRVTVGATPLVLGQTISAISGVSAANPVVLTFFAIDGGTP
jgi:hypothetical protein